MKNAPAMDFHSPQDRGYFSFGRAEIFPLLPKNISRVFEVGCGAGATLKMIKERYDVSFIGGIDTDEQSINSLRSHVDIALLGDIEKDELPQEVNDIDVILCLDVLEHLIDPWTVVRRLHRRLSDDGVIIASIPNIRYFRASLPLVVFGRWELVDAGILDKTHLRFFVRKTAIDLVTCSGLELQSIKETGLEPGRKAHLINLLTLGVFRDLFAHQYLIRVGKPHKK